MVRIAKGMRIEMDVSRASRDSRTAPGLRARDLAEVRFRVTDAQTGAPVSPLRPAAWIARSRPGETLECRDRIGRYVQGMLSFQADVDLNKFFILIMNNDQSISVVDPLLGVSGITRLYAMIVLEERGEDWAIDAAQDRMYVSMPEAGRIAIVDLADFSVVGGVDVGADPRAAKLQPDGRYLWVAGGNDADPASSVVAIDTETLDVSARLAAGHGLRRLAFSSDSDRVFIAGDSDSSITVVDTGTLRVVGDHDLGAPIADLAFSPLSDALFVVTRDGAVTALDADTYQVRSRIELEAGRLTAAMQPGGRHLLVADRDHDTLWIVDTASGELRHRIDVASQPDAITFTDTYAYVHHRGSAEVVLVPLSALDSPTAPPVQRVPIGDRPPGEYAYPALAGAIAPTGEATSVVTANPADRLVYYYMEGMIAPMGSYTTYGRVPRAVSVVDRSVREIEPGVYSAQFRVPESGDYNVAVMLDAPFVGECFAFHADPDPTLAAQASVRPAVDYLDTPRQQVGPGPMTVRFALQRAGDAEAIDVPGEVRVMATRMPGSWRREVRATQQPDGSYTATIEPDAAGAYYVWVGVPGLGLRFNDLPFHSFRVRPVAAGDISASETR